jgi:hypothetical protein
METYFVDVLVNGSTKIINIHGRSKHEAVINALNLMNRETIMSQKNKEGRWVNYGNNLFQYCVIDRNRLLPRFIAKSDAYLVNARHQSSCASI